MTTPSNTTPGNPISVYNPGYAAAATGTPYGTPAQVNDSQVVSPVIVFQVNLETVNRQGQLVPNRTTLSGNETVSEADNMRQTRTMFVPDLVAADDGEGEGGIVVGGTVGVMGIGPGGLFGQPGFLHHGAQFTVKGKKALYLKKMFVSFPASPADLLQVVSQS